MLRLIRTAAIGLAVCYALLIATMALGWWLGRDSGWALAVSNIFAIYFFLPLLPLLLIAPLLRSRTFWLATAVPVLLFVVLFGRLLLPPSVQAAEPRLRVLTMNMLYENRDYQELIAFVRERDADVLVIQELEPGLTEAIERELPDLYPYRYAYAERNSEGLGIWSHYPIVATAQPEERRFLEATIDVRGRHIHVINVHPRAPYMRVRNYRRIPLPQLQTFSTDERDRLLAQLAARIDAAPRPLIVAGDFNLTERERPYDALAARLDDAFAVAGWGLGATFPANDDAGDGGVFGIPAPLVRIDYVWSSAELPAQRAEVRCDVPGSDHCALEVDLGLMPDIERAQP
jgi:vancomycin resistance protein VanJ